MTNQIVNPLTVEQYHEMYANSLRDPQSFWGKQAEKYVTWFKRWDDVLVGDFDKLNVQWFRNGKLNVCYNCVDRHLENRAQQTAIVWEGDDQNETKKLTYSEVY